MNLRKPILMLVPAVVLTIAGSTCCASIHVSAPPASTSFRASSLNVSTAPIDETPSPKQLELQEGPATLGISMTGSANSGPQVTSSSVLVAGFDFELRLPCSDQVYISSWKWRPTPPCDELLKIPIQS